MLFFWVRVAILLFGSRARVPWLLQQAGAPHISRLNRLKPSRPRTIPVPSTLRLADTRALNLPPTTRRDWSKLSPGRTSLVRRRRQGSCSFMEQDWLCYNSITVTVKCPFFRGFYWICWTCGFSAFLYFFWSYNCIYYVEMNGKCT